ncbi:MAG: septum formation initiator family protein [Bacteroidota bacterium]
MSSRLRRRLLLAGALAVLVWVAFFDSHSLLRRATYAQELNRLTEENAVLAADNEAISDQIRRGLDAETVEKVAREQYGMRRPGDRVYRVEHPEAD